MRAFLEQIGGEWLDDFVYISKEPLKRLGFDIMTFDGGDIDRTLLSFQLDISKDVIIGSVESTVKFFKGCGIDTPTYLGYPFQLKPYLGRNIIEINFEDAHRQEYPFFIKPSKGVKTFTGTLIENGRSLGMMRDFDKIDDFERIYLSDTINFVSEYRCFIHEEEIKGIQFYLGDFKIFPNVERIETMVSSYTDANCAYTLDIGVTDNGETLLVEINDMWAIGSYGFNSREYALMCVRRMREIGRQFNGEERPLWKKLKDRYE